MVTQPTDPSETSALRAHIDSFIQQRLEPKLEASDKAIAKEDDEQKRLLLEEKRRQLLADYRREPWLASAAKRVSQIQLVTHALKFTHPNARGSSLYLQNPVLEAGSSYVGTHTMGSQRRDDVAVRNAAGLYVHSFLSEEYGGEMLLQRALRKDPVFTAALSDDPECASEWLECFASITQGDLIPSSHTLARQIYFPLDRGVSYHLLAPLFPTSLVQDVFEKLQEVRFGEYTKIAREARNHRKFHDHGYKEYPNLVTHKIGGDNPQNISKFNSKGHRNGQNWLLPSCPPVWRSGDQRPPLGLRSVFARRFGARPFVRELTTTLAAFLSKTDYNNAPIREARTNLVVQLCDELMLFVAELHQLEPGWSASADCSLDLPEALWLDPERAEHDEAFAHALGQEGWRAEIAARFGRWLNSQLRKKAKLPLGDAEQREWERTFLAEQQQWAYTIDTDLQELTHV